MSTFVDALVSGRTLTTERATYSVFGFILKKDPTREELSTFLDPMNVFALGLSWGGFQSLIKAENVTDRVLPFRYRDRTIIRVSIGLEDVEKMKVDLGEAIERLV